MFVSGLVIIIIKKSVFFAYVLPGEKNQTLNVLTVTGVMMLKSLYLIPLRIMEEKAQSGLFEGKELQNNEKAHGWSKPAGDKGRHIGQGRGKTGGNMKQEEIRGGEG